MNHINAVGLLVVATSVLVGCTPPYPTHKHMQAPGGIVRGVPDPSTVRPGTSHREEVLSEFRSVDTGVSSRWFFWGRWESSSVAMAVVTDMGVEQAPIWSLKNFLVEFDNTGTVRKTSLLSDNRIISELERVLAEHPESIQTESVPVVLVGRVSPSRKHWCQSNLVLSRSTVEFATTGNGHCLPPLRLPMQGLTVGIYSAPTGEGAPAIAFIRFTLLSSGKTPRGSGLPVSLKASDLVVLLHFLQASQQASKG